MPHPVSFDIPEDFRARADRDQKFAAFSDGLPALVQSLVEEWELTPDGEPGHGSCALTMPVRTPDGTPTVLKVGFPHEEAEHEALALQTWRGDGAAQLLRADPGRWALLLERLDAGRDLRSVGEIEACEVVAGLYSKLHVAALPRLRTLSTFVQRWTERLAALPVDVPVPRRLVEHAASLGHAFVEDPMTDAALIHGDLHYENVLAGEREPWQVIDPKPMAGDPHYEVAPMLWNRWDEAVGTGDARGTVRRRFHTIVDAAGLDEERARDWVVVRAMHNALWALEGAASADVQLDADDREWITICVALAKAVQD